MSWLQARTWTIKSRKTNYTEFKKFLGLLWRQFMTESGLEDEAWEFAAGNNFQSIK